MTPAARRSTTAPQVGVASTADGQSLQNYGSVAYNRAWIQFDRGSLSFRRGAT